MAVTIPNLQDIYNENPAKKFLNGTVGDIFSSLINVVFYIAIFLAFYWIVWGAFQYILASGKKEELAKARSRITWAIVGLLIVISAYLMITYVADIFPPINRVDLPFPQSQSKP